MNAMSDASGTLAAAPMPTIAIALAHHQAGRLQEAEKMYHAILQTQPGHVDALHSLGLLHQQCGDLATAEALIRQAIAALPAFAAARAKNLPRPARQQRKGKQRADAESKDAYLNLGHALLHNSLGRVLEAAGKPDAAIAAYQQAVLAQPGQRDACLSLGNALLCQGRLAETADCYRRAIAHQPGFAEAHNNLGAALQDLGQLEEATSCFEKALALKPDYAEAHYNLGNILKTGGKLEEAIACYRRAIEFKPDYAVAYNNLGDIFRNQGRLDEAIGSFRQALHCDPHFAYAQSNLLFCINYHPTLPAREIFAAYRNWDQEYAARLCVSPPAFANERDPQRRLRIGYVSPDFHQHPVIHFAAPLLELHDKTRFELFCYYNNTIHDSFTDRMMATSDHWITCKSMSDDQLAQRIRDDRIDILIDLAGHTADNRLLVFARRPAPVQASWLGFGYTTGLAAMDYFIGDPVFTPPGVEPLFSENIWRLPHAAWTYQPPEGTPGIADLPAARRGYVTFSCLSRSERINARVIEAWAGILRRLPSARLRLDNRNFNDSGLRHQIEMQFADLGVPATQLEITFTSPVWNIYQDVDIVLDCFPHNSGTTTYEALWMGVPVITLADRPSVGRLGASILTCIGKPQWIANDRDDYINRAVALAENLVLLAAERAALRQAMLDSPLLDRVGFVHDMEAAYRGMWHRWCENKLNQKEAV